MVPVSRGARVLHKMEKKLHAPLLVLLLLLITNAAAQSPQSPLLSALVPKLDAYPVKLTGEGNQYKLTINEPGYRMETVELRASGTAEQELFVKGTYIVYYDYGNQLTVLYEADKNGYVAKYVFRLAAQSASANLLKSAAG